MRTPNLENNEPVDVRPRFGISSMLWVVTVVAAFFAGSIWQQSQSNIDRTTTAIAIAGFFDLTGNGTDDSDKLRAMIRRNGGSVVASQDANGGIIGVIDQNTKYLVVGDMSKLERDNSRLIFDAKKNGVPVISVQKLVKWLGIQGQPAIKRSHDGFATRQSLIEQ